MCIVTVYSHFQILKKIKVKLASNEQQTFFHESKLMLHYFTLLVYLNIRMKYFNNFTTVTSYAHPIKVFQIRDLKTTH